MTITYDDAALTYDDVNMDYDGTLNVFAAPIYDDYTIGYNAIYTSYNGDDLTPAFPPVDNPASEAIATYVFPGVIWHHRR